MRTYYDIQLTDRTRAKRELHGEAIVKAGRYLIAKTLLEMDAPTVDPLSPRNPLIFSAGPFAGTSFSNANRTSVGCKSPLTGGVKEANGGGTFSYGLGQLKIAGFTLLGASPDWVVIHFKKGGSIEFEDATPYLGKGNFEAASMLHAKYGKKVTIALCGPVGEYQGLLAGIAFSDKDNRPSRLAARGGVGAVMGSKKVKAIVVDLDSIPPLHDRAKANAAIKNYAKMLQADGIVQNFYSKLGTMGMADVQNYMGGLPVRNFTAGQLANVSAGETFKMGADYIGPLNTGRGGEQTHACMPGCVIQCSNVYHDADGKEVVSPVEYETLGLLGSNCGLSDPDDLAQLNFIANDLGVDTIELGAMIGVLMEAGLGAFGDVTFMADCLAEIRAGTDKGRLWARGTARVGEHYRVRRVPVIKKQAISAYDPRVVEATGISMMATAQGADHTVGNLPRLKTREMDGEALISQSLAQQVRVAANDSLGLCVFGQSVTNTNTEFLADAINAAHGTGLTKDFFETLGRETLRLEREFNRLAGFTEKDDELPEFFYTEPVSPTSHVARFHGPDVHGMYERLPA
ncbi:MAG TPA: aldehyde ferredoxin oxidoreductase C-terminal domain-containing protein [Methylomirabilota bacterium]|nr:aldehyde ferredoxin oxidoreductase C-terminal domain-containing protein [Methylomirabilota bacterium]